MPDYAYKGLDGNSGKEVKGTIAADSEEEALQKLKAKDITPMSLEEATGMNKSVSVKFGQKQPIPRDMSVFCRQMVSVLSAGVSMTKALDLIGTQTENKVLKEAILGCKSKIEQGSTMHEAMEDYKCMRGIFATMVAAGEDSGSLETSFERMADQFEKSSALKALIKKSTSYPKMLGMVMVAVVIIMLKFVVPKFEDFLGSLGSELPAFTQALVNVSNFVQDNFIIIMIVAVGGFVGFKSAVATKQGKRIKDTIILKIPKVNVMTQKTACANMMRTMATLLATGIPMLEAIDIVRATMTNVHFEEAMAQAKLDVAQGSPLSDALEATKMFPPMVFQMIRIGEETGDIVSMLDRTAEYFDEEVKTSTEAVTAMIEPMVIVCMAGVVGGMVIALLMPMMSMYDSLDSL